MKKMVVSDSDLSKVFTVLYEELAGDVKNNSYPIFPPRFIEVIDETVVRFKKSDGPKQLDQCLKIFGATLYDFAIGRAEDASREFKASDYRQPIDASIWPVLELLLSGNARSLPQVEEVFERAKFNSALNRKLVVLKSVFGRFGSQISKVTGFFRIENKSTKIIISVFIGILALVEVYFYWKINWVFSNGVGVLLFTGVFLGLCSVISMGWIGNDIKTCLALPGILLVFALYAGLTFWAPMDNIDSDTPVNNYSVLVDRKTGDFVARLPIHDNEKRNQSRLVWPYYFINHFRYKIVPGIPLDGDFSKTIELENDERKFPLGVKVRFSTGSPDDYVERWKFWKNNGQIEKAISDLIESFKFDLNGRFAEVCENPRTETYSFEYISPDVVFNSEEIDRFKERITAKLDAEKKAFMKIFADLLTTQIATKGNLPFEVWVEPVM